MNRSTRAVAPYIGAVAVLVAILLGWQWYATSNPTFFLPPPTVIGTYLQTNWFSGPPAQLFLSDGAIAAIGQTFTGAVAGWLIAGVLGIVIGTILGRWRVLDDLTSLPFLLLRSVPAVAIIPICILLFGFGVEMKLIVVSFSALWPTLLNTVAGVRDIKPTQLDVARLARLGTVARFFRVLVPAASPKIFAGLRVSMSLAIVMAVGAELFAGSGGVGGLLLSAQSTFNVPAMWSALFILAILGLIINYAFLLLERIALRWHTRKGLQ